MSPETVITISQQALNIMVLLSAPMLLSALAIGLLIGMLQAATQINEMTLSFIPKLGILVGVLWITGPWMLEVITSYTVTLISDIPLLID